MILIVLLSVALGGVLVWALYAEPVPPRPRPAARHLSTWTMGEDVRRHAFPIVLAGYDPAAVDAHLSRIAEVHDDLRQLAAPPSPGGGAQRTVARDLAAQQSLQGAWPAPPPPSVLDG